MLPKSNITNICRVMSGVELKRDKVIVNTCSCLLDILWKAVGCNKNFYHSEFEFSDSSTLTILYLICMVDQYFMIFYKTPCIYYLSLSYNYWVLTSFTNAYEWIDFRPVADEEGDRGAVGRKTSFSGTTSYSIKGSCSTRQGSDPEISYLHIDI